MLQNVDLRRTLKSNILTLNVVYQCVIMFLVTACFRCAFLKKQKRSVEVKVTCSLFRSQIENTITHSLFDKELSKRTWKRQLCQVSMLFVSWSSRTRAFSSWNWRVPTETLRNLNLWTIHGTIQIPLKFGCLATQ